MTSHKEKPVGTVTARARMGVVKTHGPNSPDVLSGKVPLGHEETVEGETKLIEVDYDLAVRMWGQETADDLFAKRVAKEADNG